jgi:Tfp pilus assembly protein PilO
MNLDEKKQLIILAAVCGVFFCIEVVVGWNLSSKNSETRLVLEQLEAREASALVKKDRIPDLERELSDLEEIVEEYTEILPREDEVLRDAFVDTITQLCKESGLVVTGAEPVSVEQFSSPQRGRVNPAAAKVVPPFQRHKYRFEMIGEFSQFHRFVNLVENHTRFLRVDAFNLFPIDRSDDLSAASKPHKNFTIEISTYVYKEKTVDSKEMQ